MFIRGAFTLSVCALLVAAMIREALAADTAPKPNILMILVDYFPGSSVGR